jgi:WD40 repeat protein
MVQRHVLQIFLKLVVKQETFCYIGFSLVLCTPQHSQEILFLANMFLMPTKCIFSVLICTRCYGGLVNNFCCRTSDDGTCRIWDALDSSRKSRVYMPSPKEPPTNVKGPGVPPPPAPPIINQVICCAFNADGSIFVTGSSDKIARV